MQKSKGVFQVNFAWDLLVDFFWGRKIPAALPVISKTMASGSEGSVGWPDNKTEFQQLLKEGTLDDLEICWSSRWESYIQMVLKREGVEVAGYQLGRAAPHISAVPPVHKSKVHNHALSLEHRQLFNTIAKMKARRRRQLAKSWQEVWEQACQDAKLRGRLSKAHGLTVDENKFDDPMLTLQGQLEHHQRDHKEKLAMPQS